MEIRGGGEGPEGIGQRRRNYKVSVSSLFYLPISRTIKYR